MVFAFLPLFFILSLTSCIVSYHAYPNGPYLNRLDDQPSTQSDVPLFCEPMTKNGEIQDRLFSFLVPGSYPLLPPQARHIPQDNFLRTDAQDDVAPLNKRTLTCTVEIAPLKLHRSEVFDVGRRNRNPWVFQPQKWSRPMDFNTEPFAFPAMKAQLVSFIPGMHSKEDYDVIYSIKVGESSPRSYSYKITKEGWAWSLLLPFAWMNLFTTSETEALGTIHKNFLENVKEDGYLVHLGNGSPIDQAISKNTEGLR